MQLTQGTTQSAMTASGTASGNSYAVVGALQGSVTASGCTTGLFQQPCISAASYTEFYDQWHLVGAPNGTPVSVRFTLTTYGTGGGQGTWGYTSNLSDGFFATQNSDGSTGVVDFLPPRLSKSASWTATYTIGAEYPLTGTMSLGVGERFCWGGSQDCGIVISAGMSLYNAISAEILTPGLSLQMIAASGKDYLAASAPVRGDLNGDGIIDKQDLAIITAALNKPASGTQDPRDLNHDGLINALDARILVTLCSHPGCATQ